MSSSPQPGERASAWRWIRISAILLSLFVGYQLLLIVRSWAEALLNVVLILVFGGVLALLLAPINRLLRDRLRLPRTVAALLTLLGLIAIAGLLVFSTARQLFKEATGLAASAPHWTAQLQSLIDQQRALLGQHGVAFAPPSVAGLLQQFGAALPHVLLYGLGSFATVVVDLVLVLVAAFWLLRDGAALRAALESWLPDRPRSELAFASDAITVIVGGYVRAQLLVALMVGVLAAAGCYVVGVPYPLVVGSLAGVFELVPIVGPFAGGAVAILLALTKDPLLVIPTVAVFLVIHALEGYVVAPRVQGHFVQLHPLWAMMALFAGIEAGGFIGALLSIPAASLGAVFLKATVGEWKAQRPDLFARPAADPATQRRRRRLLDQFRVFGRRPSL